MIEELRNNINIEIRMLREMSEYLYRALNSSADEARLFMGVVESLKKRTKILNNAIPDILGEVSLAQKIPSSVEKKNTIQQINFKQNNTKLILREKDKEKFLNELRISENLVRKLKQREKIESKKKKKYKKANPYAKFANKIFFNLSNRLVNEEKYFKPLRADLIRSNMNVLTTTYVSIILLSTSISFFVGIIAFLFFSFFNLSFSFPYLSAHSESIFMRILKVSWILIAVPVATAGFLYFYPSSEKKTLARQIDRELPFVVIHMGSISGSGIEPTQIFKIIALSREYKDTKGEIRKLLNQINVYGYDLITALKNVAKSTPSQKMAELLNGLASTIQSGGNLEDFFEKRAESLLLEYRLEREKFIKTAETFMNLYISIVVATPMILLLLLILISVSGLGLAGLGITQLTLMIIGVVAVINFIFIGILTIKQPGY